MMKSVLLASSIAAASAFAPSQEAARTSVQLSESKADLESIAEKLNPSRCHDDLLHNYQRID